MMVYHEYTAFYFDGDLVHHVHLIAAVYENQLQLHGLEWLRSECWKAVIKRVQATAMLTHWVVKLTAAEVEEATGSPAADLKAIYNITTT